MKLNKRRLFLQAGFLSTVVFISYKAELFATVTPLQTLSVLQEDLFPSEGSSPSQKQINAKSYLSLILQHNRVSDTDKEFIKNGVKWLNEASVEKYKKIYFKLDENQRQVILQNISQTSWGESFIADILKYIFEAMLGDPIYGINKNESGWKWLNHEAGLPRPTKAYM